jgi:hypothetical protein
MPDKATLPTDSDARKGIPLARGCFDYFPAALAAVAELSRIGNEKHNPGEDIHWARGKSGDHADCILRHLADRGAIDTDGLSHSVKVAWRALALLQEELEAAGAPLARGARAAGTAETALSTKTRKWDEGWTCIGCGSTRLAAYITEDDIVRYVGDGVVVCSTQFCFAGMVREP